MERRGEGEEEGHYNSSFFLYKLNYVSRYCSLVTGTNTNQLGMKK